MGVVEVHPYTPNAFPFNNVMLSMHINVIKECFSVYFFTHVFVSFARIKLELCL